MHARHRLQIADGAFALFAGILGENLTIPSWMTKSVKGFWGVNSAALLFCIVVFYGIMTYIRYKRLM